MMMVVYDLVLEQVAPDLDMWQWAGDVVPFRNYLSWFLVALVFQICGKLIRIRFTNRMAAVLLIIQFLFFLILVIFGTNYSSG
jgi:putative membrane protein